ncbi:hypothetical protein ACTG9Q_32465 [Actinokineospora sp. 24-640]
MSESTEARMEDAELLAVLEDDVFGESGEARSFTESNNNNYGCGVEN